MVDYKLFCSLFGCVQLIMLLGLFSLFMYMNLYLCLPLQMSNTEGEIYSLSVRSPQFKWIQDFSSFDKVFTITPGNNGCLYVTVPVRVLVLALDVTTGNILWQRNTGPLSTTECAPVVDSNGK